MTFFSFFFFHINLNRFLSQKKKNCFHRSGATTVLTFFCLIQKCRQYASIRCEFKQVWFFSLRRRLQSLRIFLIDFFSLLVDLSLSPMPLDCSARLEKCQIKFSKWDERMEGKLHNGIHTQSLHLQQILLFPISYECLCESVSDCASQLLIRNLFLSGAFFFFLSFYLFRLEESNRTDFLTWFNWNISNLVYISKLYFPVSIFRFRSATFIVCILFTSTIRTVWFFAVRTSCYRFIRSASLGGTALISKFHSR